MRTAELVVALAMAALSLAFMWKAAELPIGWVRGSGPGGGAMPFWLAAGMLVCCVAIIGRWALRRSPPSRSTEPFLDRDARRLFLLAAGSLGVAIAAIHVIGVYGAIPLFLIFYMRVLGRHSWRLIAVMAIASPVVTFLFFDIGLKEPLPKGYLEPLFYPLYDIFL